MVKKIIKHCPACSKDAENLIEKLNHAFDEIFNVEHRCTKCGTLFQVYMHHTHLKNFTRVAWAPAAMEVSS